MNKAAFIAIAVLASLLTGGLVALVSAGNDSGRPADDAVVAMPREGDEVHYRWTADGITSTESQPEFHLAKDLELRWSGPAMEDDSYGRPHMVEVVEGAVLPVDRNATEDVRPFRFTFRNGTIAPERTNVTISMSGWRTETIGPLPFRQHVFNATSEKAYFDWSIAPLNCLVRAGWQGQQVAAAVGSVYADVCPGVDHLLLGTGRGWAPAANLVGVDVAMPLGAFDSAAVVDGVGWEDVDGIRAYHLSIDSTIDFYHNMLHVTIHDDWWLVPGLAYPLRYRESASFEGSFVLGGETETGNITMELRLTGVVAGDTPIPADPDPPEAPIRRPDMDFAPLGNDGPAAGEGEQLAFPLHEAVDVVRDDIDPNGGALWLAQHPDARLMMATYCNCGSSIYSLAYPVYVLAYPIAPVPYVSPPADGTGAQWYLFFQRPNGDFWHVIVERFDRASVDGGQLEMPLPVHPTHVYWMGSYRGDANDVAYDAAALPDEVPTIASVIAAARREGHAETGTLVWVEWYLESDGFSMIGADIDTDQSTSLSFELNPYDGGVYGLNTYRRDHQVHYTPLGVGGLEEPHTAAAHVAAAAPPTGLVLAGAASASLLALLLVAYLYPWIKYYGAGLLMVVPGYAKLRKDKVLDNELREQILERVRDDPGVSPPEIHKDVDAAWSTVVYHLGVLEKNGLVSSLLDGRHKRFFPADSVDWSRRGELAALKNDRTKQIYHLLLEEPGLRRRDLATRVGVTLNAIEWHLERLQAAGLAGIDKDGRAHRIYANPPPAATPPDGIEVA